MKIEKINENQIRCTLTREDLANREINLSELAYGSEKARTLFRDMMQQAAHDFGFEANNIPLMIEAIPLSSDSIILIITKVEDPEELDTRFSKFSPAEEDDDSPWSALASEFLEGADGLVNLSGETGKNTGKAAPPAPPVREESPRENLHQSVRIYLFDSLDLVCEAARETGPSFTGENVLYKNPVSGKYYLVLRKTGTDEISFSRTCNALSEYGTRIRQDAAAEAYYEEHFEILVRKDALQVLCRL